MPTGSKTKSRSRQMGEIAELVAAEAGESGSLYRGRPFQTPTCQSSKLLGDFGPLLRGSTIRGRTGLADDI